MYSLLSQKWFIYYFSIIDMYNFGNIISVGVTNFYGISIENFA